MDFLDLVKERYSVRRYSDQVVEQEKLDLILEAGRVAPTAVNNQPQKIYVLQSRDALDKINSVANTYNAPVVLLLCADMDQVWKSPLEENYDTSEMDVSIVGTHMMLEAWNVGVGSLWIRYFDSKKVKEVFSLPENVKPVCLLCLGYPSKDCHPSSRLHGNRKTIEETVTYW